MKGVLKKIGNFFSRSKKEGDGWRVEKEHREKVEGAFRRVGERYGRAITRLSER